MKILYISTEPIYPANTGSRIRSYQLIKAMAKKHDVGYAYFSADPIEWSNDLDCKYVQQIKLDTALSDLNSRQRLSLLLRAAVFNSFPMTDYYLDSEQVEQIQEVIKNNAPDIVILQSTYIVPIAKKIKQVAPHTKIILDAHNIESLLQDRMIASASSKYVRPIKKLVNRNLARKERSIDQNITAIAAVSNDEAEWFKQHNPHIKVEVVQNGVDVDYFSTTRKLPADSIIAFSGSMSYLPNHEGVIWFANNVWPLITKKIHNAKWLIIGKEPAQSIQDLAKDPDITVTGTVEDVRDWVERSRLSVVPLLSGGGTRLKILEAMAMQRVVVSTTVGAEGIIDTPGIIRIDEPHVMAEKIIELLSSGELEKTGQVNRKVVSENYSWKAIGQKMNDLVDVVISSN